MEKELLDIPATLLTRIHRTENDPRPVVVMTCGIAGSGKSTLAKTIVSNFPSFVRLSIDEIIFAKHGLYGIDYAKDKYFEYLDEASLEYDKEFIKLLEEGKRDIVLDRSFYAKGHRDEFKALIEAKGSRWILIYFNASKEVLSRRVKQRRQNGLDANSAYEVTDEILDRYFAGFEIPRGEGEIVVDVV